MLSLLGVTGYITPDGLDYSALMVFSLVWGFGGAFISLLMSRWMAKMAMGVQLVDGRTGQAELDWLLPDRRAADAQGRPADAGSRHLRLA